MNEIKVIDRGFSLGIYYNGQPMCTTEQLAQAYNTDKIKLRQNFNNNKDRYKEGKHYILLQGEDLQALLRVENFDLQNASKIRSLYLWTERGAMLHAKSLNTDKAWEIYERLVDFYFQAKENKTPIHTDASKEIPAAIPNIHVQTAIRAIQSLINEGFTIQQTIRGEDFREPFLGYSDDAGSIYIKPSLLYDRYCSLIPGTALNRGAFYQILDEAGLIRKNNKDWVHNRHGYSPYIHITCKNLKQYPFLRFRHEVLASFGLLPM